MNQNIKNENNIKQNDNNKQNLQEFNIFDKKAIFNDNESDESLINSNFSIDFADIIGKDLFREEREYLKRQNTNNETVLEQKINKKIQNEENLQKLSSFVQSREISLLESSLHISLSDSDKESDYLVLRQISFYDNHEYDFIRQKVSKNLYSITDLLLKKQYPYNDINPNKKVGSLLPLITSIENTYLNNPQYIKIMNQKYQRLKNYICNYRTIYGDGNCYYRAVMFRYFELLILNKKSEYLKLVIIDIYKSFQSEEIQKRLLIGTEKINPELTIQIMIIILELIENDKIIEAHQIFYKTIAYSKNFDLSLILYFKFILYDYIKKSEKKIISKRFSSFNWKFITI